MRIVRSKDMILVSRGLTSIRNEIEDVVMQHSGVQEVAAVGDTVGQQR